MKKNMHDTNHPMKAEELLKIVNKMIEENKPYGHEMSKGDWLYELGCFLLDESNSEEEITEIKSVIPDIN